MKKFLLLISLLLIASIVVRINTDESGQTRGIMNQGSENYNKKFFPVTQEEIDAVKTENRVVYMSIYRNFYSGLGSVVSVNALFDNGNIYCFEFGPPLSDSEAKKYYSAEYMWDYLNSTDLAEDKYIIRRGYSDNIMALKEYIVRLNRIYNKTGETIIENIPPIDCAGSEAEFYGIIYENHQPEIIFLRKKNENNGEITKNADAEAQKAFNLHDEVWKQIIWEE